jgi:1-aminocyclopropane-1-carboxylate deaminase/D-cysteine desulfhydrase-like pyridoxal-dependent ACC family enzyme
LEANTRIDRLKKTLEQIPQYPYATQSRVHPLRSFRKGIFIKRDDELGFGISGTKIRKYRTLIPYLIKQHPKEVVVIGGAHSNNVLGLSQLLLENGLKPVLFLRESGNKKPIGNSLLTRMLVPAQDIHWIARKDWEQVNELAEAYARSKSNVSIIPEGSYTPEGFFGALSLVLDILRNEEEDHLAFDHIFIDAGTGMSAIALILGYAWLQKTAAIHVLLLADDERIFLEKLSFLRSVFASLVGFSCPEPNNFYLHTPVTARSFGSINRQVWEEIESFAKNEGIFLDPLYSAKLIMEGRKWLQKDQSEQTVLFIHSGGALSLSGFQDTMRNRMMVR